MLTIISFGNNCFTLIACFLLCFFTKNICSQAIPSFTQFYLQDYYYNSSLIGSEDNACDVSFIHRKWSADFFGTAPNTTNFGFDKSFKKRPKWGFAFQILNDNQGQAFSSNNIRGGFSYCVNPKGHVLLTFGLGLNYLNTQFNPSDFENMEPGDQLLNAGQLTNQFLSPSFGLNLKYNPKENFFLQLGFASTFSQTVWLCNSKEGLTLVAEEEEGATLNVAWTEDDITIKGRGDFNIGMSSRALRLMASYVRGKFSMTITDGPIIIEWKDDPFIVKLYVAPVE